MSAGARLDFTLPQGSTFKKVLSFEDGQGGVVQLTGYTAKLQVRPWPSSSTILLEASTDNGRITVSGADNTLTINISDEVTAALTPWGDALYDLELQDSGGNRLGVLWGHMYFYSEVTR